MRMGGSPLHWDAAAGYISAYEVFQFDDVARATRHIFRVTCPTDFASKQQQDETPPTSRRGSSFSMFLPNGARNRRFSLWQRPEEEDSTSEEHYKHVAWTVMFLVVQQHSENLRQAESYKRRTWQYLTASMPHCHPDDSHWDKDVGAKIWELFRARAANVCSLQRFLTAKVEVCWVRYGVVWCGVACHGVLWLVVVCCSLLWRGVACCGARFARWDEDAHASAEGDVVAIGTFQGPLAMVLGTCLQTGLV